MNKDIIRAQKFMSKWCADGHIHEPTDEALTEAFKNCAKPPKTEIYPLIRVLLKAPWNKPRLDE